MGIQIKAAPFSKDMLFNNFQMLVVALMFGWLGCKPKCTFYGLSMDSFVLLLVKSFALFAAIIVENIHCKLTVVRCITILAEYSYMDVLCFSPLGNELEWF